MILVRHLSHELGCLLATPARSPGSYSTSCGRLVCSYYVRCVSTPEILADVSVNHSRTGAVKLLITRRDEPSSKLSGYRSPDYSLSRRPQLAAIQPRSKRMTRLAPRVLCSRAVSVAMPAPLWGTWTPAEPTWPRPGLFVDRSYVPCAGQRYCAGH